MAKIILSNKEHKKVIEITETRKDFIYKFTEQYATLRWIGPFINRKTGSAIIINQNQWDLIELEECDDEIGRNEECEED